MRPRARAHLAVTACGVAALAGAGPLAGQDSVRVDRLDEVREGSSLPPGWELRAVRGERPPAVRVEAAGERADGPALVLVADSAAGQAWLELDEERDPARVRISWRWWVDSPVDGASLRIPEMDDSPARFFVVFDGRGLLGRPRVLFYSWGGEGDVEGDAFVSHAGGRLGVVVVRTGSAPTGTWLTETRVPAEDFRRVFGSEPGRIRAVGLMADTDQTGARTEARLGEVWISRTASPMFGRPPPDP